ncbi:hypothetical protein BVRB_7g178610 [Beta vulgaris subsp. vulgaris]|uniref:Uncharacterized protein n=1 Tax=Beta vulgaris subsp. vulgaris TaxID=3555 RepID=A0A0J8B766_BETVV|nr:hypothetical protein BVRB_7g178610 [Beta vulgaris subsp. vulgaris]
MASWQWQNRNSNAFVFVRLRTASVRRVDCRASLPCRKERGCRPPVTVDAMSP